MSTAPIRQVGFVGIGTMGWPMAARLVRAGFDVVAADAAAGRAEAFAAQAGGRAAGSAAGAAGFDALVTMLPTSTDVADVLRQAAAALRPGTLVIEMSSGVPAVTQALAADLAGRGVGLIDCPVSGGAARARTGELAIMAGGDAGELRRAEPLLRAMSTSVHHCGGVGAGQAMKALNNLVSAGGFLIGVEALLIGQQFGLDPAVMVDVLNSATGMNNSTQRKFKQCRELWSSAAARLGPGQDHTAAARLSEQLAGTELIGTGRDDAVSGDTGPGGTVADATGPGDTGPGEPG